MILSVPKTCSAILDRLENAYGPCAGFSAECSGMIWNPIRGHVPRGFLGATGDPSEVELVLVVAEPGDPHDAENYRQTHSPRALLEEVSQYTLGCFSQGTDQFHRNVRYILDACWPEHSFECQLRRVWITE